MLGCAISEALALTERDLDVTGGAILVRRATGGKRREVDTRTDVHQPGP